MRFAELRRGAAWFGVLVALVPVGACSSSSDEASPPSSTSTSQSAPRPATGERPPVVDVADATQHFVAYLTATFANGRTDWYTGYFNRSGDVTVFVNTGDAGEAAGHCADIASAAAFVFDGFEYIVAVKGELPAAGDEPPTELPPTECAKVDVPTDDPTDPTQTASEPAAERFSDYVTAYFEDDAWFQRIDHVVDDPSPIRFDITTNDERPTDVDTRCAEVRALADWLLRGFELGFTLWVQGPAGDAPEPVWPAQECAAR